MPLIHIAMRAGKPAAYRQAIFDTLYRALRETFNVPEDDVVFIQITANNTRGLEQKKALFSRTAQLLGESPGLRPEDVFISIVEVDKENWSFGHGLAQYA